MQVQEEFGSFSNYIWKFTNGTPVVNRPNGFKELASTTSLSDAISKDLKKRGFKFVGSTIVYAFLQATGLINDHLSDCWKAPK
jgi:DNA-3-methyladenine glycosylase I